MFDWLKRPYPYLRDATIKLALSLMIGLICFLFLLIFKPFGLAQVESVTFIFGFGVIAAAVLILHYFVFPYAHAGFFDEEKWTIGKQLLLFTSIILFIGTSIYFYNSTVGRDIAPQFGLFRFIYFAFAVGILPILFMTYFIEKVAARRNSDLAGSIEILTYPKKKQTIIIKSENQSEEDLVIELSDFIYAKSSSNYSDVFYFHQGSLQNSLLRLSLKGIENQIDAENAVVRCHKSYLVNKNHVRAVQGNARSLVLELDGIEEKIPVSRRFSRSAFF